MQEEFYVILISMILGILEGALRGIYFQYSDLDSAFVGEKQAQLYKTGGTEAGALGVHFEQNDSIIFVNFFEGMGYFDFGCVEKDALDN